jgi:hypothetical protein
MKQQGRAGASDEQGGQFRQGAIYMHAKGAFVSVYINSRSLVTYLCDHSDTTPPSLLVAERLGEIKMKNQRFLTRFSNRDFEPEAK